MTGDELVREVSEAMLERDQLRRKVNVLNAKLIEISDLVNSDQERAAEIRRAYRQGYKTGYSAGRASSEELTNPERRARGWIREAIASGP
jgi:hypothetical protein